MATAYLVLVCALVIALVSTILVFHKHYEDGLVGRVGLAFMALAGAARAADLVERDMQANVSPIGLLLWCGLAMFLARHLYRFMRWRKSGEGDWRGRAATCGKQ